MALMIETFALVLGASFFHAIWNFVARKTKGNMGVLWLGMFIGVVIYLPLAIYFWTPVSDWKKAIMYIFFTSVAHAFYVVLLALAYKHGDISLVYPVARGTGVGLTSVAAYFVLGEDISYLGWIGIWSIVSGVVLLGLPPLQTLFRRKPTISYVSLTNTHQDTSAMDDLSESEKKHASDEPPNSVELTTVDVDQPTLTTLEELQKQFQDKKDARNTLILAFCVGITICAYSINDKLGVQVISPVAFIVAGDFFANVLSGPYVLWKHRDDCQDSIKNLKKYMPFIGVFAIGSYLAILYAFTQANASYVVALREVSVVFGAILGFVVLKEKFTIQKGIGIGVVALGLILLKIA